MRIQRNMQVFRLLAICLLACSLSAIAQAPLTEWSNETLNLRFSYPADLAKADPTLSMQDGHLALLGISGTGDPILAAATRCLLPELFLQLPSASDDPTVTASIVLAELDVTCLTSEQQTNARDILLSMAELVGKVPGMSSLGAPSTYTVGWQKVHMAAAQGQPGGADRIYTMGISTSWNNHLLVWYFSSNNIAQLNRITKSIVRFGRNTAEPLYPLAINDGRAH